MKLYRQMLEDLTRAYPEGEARALVRRTLEDGFGLSRTDVLLGKDSELSADDLANVQEIVARLLRHEPIQYILGFTEFCGHRFLVGPGVLIPRPETQQLVQLVLDRLSALPWAGPSGGAAPDSPWRLLDIGTGSGCIALSLGLALPDAQVTAWDVSEEALAIARSNADRYPQARVTLEQADILAPPVDDRRWHVVVSNPPYVRQSEAAWMERNVLDHEPHLALFVPDDDPLRFYRAIAAYARRHLVAGGLLCVEINQALGAATAEVFRAEGFTGVRVTCDSFGCDRFVQAVLAE